MNESRYIKADLEMILLGDRHGLLRLFPCFPDFLFSITVLP